MSTHKLRRVALCPLKPEPDTHLIALPSGTLPQLPSNACAGDQCAWFCLQGDPRTGQPMVDGAGNAIGSCGIVVAAGQLAQVAGILGSFTVTAKPAATGEAPTPTKPS